MLRGTLAGVGVSLGLPPLQAMFNAHGTAHADGSAIPQRLGVFFWGNGVKLDRWIPGKTGADWELSPALKPLAAVKDHLSVVTGMNVKTGNPHTHHSGCVGILSGAPLIEQPHPNSVYSSTFSKPSIDQVAAAAIGKDTRFRSLEVGISTRLNKAEGTTLAYLSHNGPDSPNPAEYDPTKLFNRVFGAEFMQASSADAAMISRRWRKSVLDAVAGDIAALNARVGSHDRARLAQHLDNVRTIEKRLAVDASSPALVACKQPAQPGPTGDQDGHEQLAQRTQAMSDLIAVALACDQTRVFSMMFSGGVTQTVFWQVGAERGHHDLSHDEPGDQPLIHKSTVFTMEQFATLLGSLKGIAEGDGSLLDHCAIVASSDVAEGRDHTLEDYPLLVAGRGGGALKYPGVHHRGNGENTSHVLLSVLRAAGLQLSEFGTDGGKVSDGCSAIES